jgi:hypothetical protein
MFTGSADPDADLRTVRFKGQWTVKDVPAKTSVTRMGD